MNNHVRQKHVLPAPPKAPQAAPPVQAPMAQNQVNQFEQMIEDALTGDKDKVSGLKIENDRRNSGVTL